MVESLPVSAGDTGLIPGWGISPGEGNGNSLQYACLGNPMDILQEGGTLPGPETGLLTYTRKWIVWGDTCADKARDFIGKGHPGGEQEGQGTQENCSAAWLAVLGFMVMGLVSGLSLANHSDSVSFQVVLRSMPERRILGGGRICGVSFWPFLNSSSWWWLISPVFLTRTSCHKTIHSNSYYGVWPGWAVSVSVLPLTKIQDCQGNVRVGFVTIILARPPPWKK